MWEKNKNTVIHQDYLALIKEPLLTNPKEIARMLIIAAEGKKTLPIGSLIPHSPLPDEKPTETNLIQQTLTALSAKHSDNEYYEEIEKLLTEMLSNDSLTPSPTAGHK